MTDTIERVELRVPIRVTLPSDLPIGLGLAAGPVAVRVQGFPGPVGAVGPQGPQGEAWQETFESVACYFHPLKNLRLYH